MVLQRVKTLPVLKYSYLTCQTRRHREQLITKIRSAHWSSKESCSSMMLAELWLQGRFKPSATLSKARTDSADCNKWTTAGANKVPTKTSIRDYQRVKELKTTLILQFFIESAWRWMEALTQYRSKTSRLNVQARAPWVLCCLRLRSRSGKTSWAPNAWSRWASRRRTFSAGRRNSWHRKWSMRIKTQLARKPISEFNSSSSSKSSTFLIRI